MLDIAYLKNLDFFKSFTQIAGEEGLFRNVSNVVILDYEGIEEKYFGFNEGDFVISNLMFAKNNPERIYNSFKALIDLGVAAFAIKTVIFKELPQKVIDYCNKKKVPVFLFHDIFIEDVILNINDYLRASTNYSYYEKMISQFLLRPDHTVEITEFLNSMNIYQQESYVSSIYIVYREKIAEIALWRIVNMLQVQIQHMNQYRNIYAIKYKAGILLFQIYEDKGLIPDNICNNWKDILKLLSLSQEMLYIGMNDCALPIMKLDLSIKRCIYAIERHNYKEQKNIITYSDIGYENIFLDLKNSDYSKEYLLEMIKKINPEYNSFEEFKKSSIYTTLQACVINYFDMEEAGRSLFQHPNTIRYRLKKVKEQIHMEDDSIFRMLIILLVECI